MFLILLDAPRTESAVPSLSMLVLQGPPMTLDGYLGGMKKLKPARSWSHPHHPLRQLHLLVIALTAQKMVLWQSRSGTLLCYPR